MAEDAQWGQRAVAVPCGHLSSASSVLRGLASILLAARLSAALLSGGGWRCHLSMVRWRQCRGRPTATAAAAIRTVAGRLCTLSRHVRVSAFVPASAVMATLKGAVEVDADAVAGDSWVLVGQGENEGGVVTKADPPLPYAQAALRLAEEHHVWGKRKVLVVLQWIPAEELGGLGQAVAARLSGGNMDTCVVTTKQQHICVIHGYQQVPSPRLRVFNRLTRNVILKLELTDYPDSSIGSTTLWKH